MTFVAFIGMLCASLDAAEQKASTTAQRPTNTTNTMVNAQAAHYKRVKTAASRFDEMFLVAPATQGELRSAIAMMVAQGASVRDLFRLHDRVPSQLRYIVSSAMTARAESPEQHAQYRCVYAQDLQDVLETVSEEARREGEKALEEASAFERSAASAYLASSLGAFVYGLKDGDLDKSWEFFKNHQELLSCCSCVQGCYFDNWGSAIVCGNKDRIRISDKTLSEASEYLEALLRDNNLGSSDRAGCAKGLQALSHITKGGTMK